MAKVTIYEDDCRLCSKPFRYTFNGTERYTCTECTANAKKAVDTRKVTDSDVPTFGLLSDASVRFELATSPVRRTSGDGWLIEPHKLTKDGKPKDRNGDKRTVSKPRTSVCEVCNVEFSYTAPGRLRTRCDEHPRTADKAKERTATCRYCKHEFTFTGKGKTRVVCHRALCQAAHKPEKKTVQEVTGARRAERLILMMNERIRANPTLYKDQKPIDLDVSLL